MKRSYKYLIILFIITCFIITGCSCTREDSGEPNQKVSALKFYAPSNYKSRSDLRGAIYNDDSRRIFATGDTNDYNTFMYIDVLKQKSTNSLEERIKELNEQSTNENEPKYVKKEHKSLEVYGKEGFENQNGDVDIIDYTYMTMIDEYQYTIKISGPKAKSDEVKELANKVFNSLEKETSLN